MPLRDADIIVCLRGLAAILTETDDQILVTDAADAIERLSTHDPRAYISVLFDGPPSHESGRFVEVDDPDGCSINAGEWIERPDGLWELRIPSDRDKKLELQAEVERLKAAHEQDIEEAFRAGLSWSVKAPWPLSADTPWERFKASRKGGSERLGLSENLLVIPEREKGGSG